MLHKHKNIVQKLLDSAASYDDDLMMKVLEEEEPTEEEIKAAIRKGVFQLLNYSQYYVVLLIKIKVYNQC